MTQQLSIAEFLGFRKQCLVFDSLRGCNRRRAWAARAFGEELSRRFETYAGGASGNQSALAFEPVVTVTPPEGTILVIMIAEG